MVSLKTRVGAPQYWKWIDHLRQWWYDDDEPLILEVPHFLLGIWGCDHKRQPAVPNATNTYKNRIGWEQLYGKVVGFPICRCEFVLSPSLLFCKSHVFISCQIIDTVPLSLSEQERTQPCLGQTKELWGHQRCLKVWNRCRVRRILVEHLALCQGSELWSCESMIPISSPRFYHINPYNWII